MIWWLIREDMGLRRRKVSVDNFYLSLKMVISLTEKEFRVSLGATGKKKKSDFFFVMLLSMHLKERYSSHVISFLAMLSSTCPCDFRLRYPKVWMKLMFGSLDGSWTERIDMGIRCSGCLRMRKCHWTWWLGVTVTRVIADEVDDGC